ncbi:glycoside hydrolase family 15 protein [Infundibulicybe gibba]|nr:glycoside hydrolase family 15 protein [Infundibulicybe gibba]
MMEQHMPRGIAGRVRPHNYSLARLAFGSLLFLVVIYAGFLLSRIMQLPTGMYKAAISTFLVSSIEKVHVISQTEMHVALLSAVGLCTTVLAQSNVVDTYISTESPIAQAGLLANIGPNGSRASGAKDPDYLYTRGEDDSLRASIDDFVWAERTLQQTSNPSGSVSTGGLDGPALRATALIAYANWLLSHSNASYVISTLWPLIKLDLDYTKNYWNQTGFDLWEEVSSASFFTTAVQHRALREGAALEAKVAPSANGDYATQANHALCFLQSYWNPSQKYITSNTGGGRSGKDSNSVLASIHTFDAAAGCDPTTFQPCSDKALSNLKVYVDSFRAIYPINNGIPASQAIATGRYPEDVYYGGNPWYITTAAVAEQLYDAHIVWKAQGSLKITDISLPFFQQFSPSVTTGTYASSSTSFQSIVTGVKIFADGFLAMNAKYTPSNGALAEQYHRSTGAPLSARDLTWSYASALTVFAARKGVVPESWGAQGVRVPSVCQSNAGPTVQATFTVRATTTPGENIFLTGSVDSLKGWSPENALALSSANYPIWSVTVTVPASANIEYKYIRKNNGAVSWESDPNNMLTTPESGSLTINDNWR